MIHVCKNPEMRGGFHFLAHGLYIFVLHFCLFVEVCKQKTTLKDALLDVVRPSFHFKYKINFSS